MSVDIRIEVHYERASLGRARNGERVTIPFRSTVAVGDTAHFNENKKHLVWVSGPGWVLKNRRTQ